MLLDRTEHDRMFRTTDVHLPRAALLMVRGDWEWLCQCFRFRHFQLQLLLLLLPDCCCLPAACCCCCCCWLLLAAAACCCS